MKHNLFKLMASLFLLSSCTLFQKEGGARNEEDSKKRVQDQDFVPKTPAVENELKSRLVILPFLEQGLGGKIDLQKARQRFLVDLNRKGQVMALESEDFKIKTPRDEKTLGYDLESISKDLRPAGVSGVLEGQVLSFQVKRSSGQVGIVRNVVSTFEIKLRVRILSVRQGREIFNTQKTLNLDQENIRVAERISTDRLIETDPELVSSMIEEAFLEYSEQVSKAMLQIPWEGRLAALQGERVFLNVGKISGLRVGDILRVVEEGEEVFDPESGKRLGQVQGRVKGTLEVVGFFGQDGSIAVIHSGSGFKENDRVELY